MFERADLHIINAIQQQAGQFVKMNKDGTTQVPLNHQPYALVSPLGLGAFAAMEFMLPPTLLVGSEVQPLGDFCNPTGEGCLPLPVCAADFTKSSFWHPAVAPFMVVVAAPASANLEQIGSALVPADASKAEFKKMVPWGRECSGANKASDEAITSPQSLHSLTKAEKINLTAPAYAPNGSRVNAFDEVTPAARGATTMAINQNVVAVPFMSLQR